MNTETALESAKTLLAQWAMETTAPEPDRLDLKIPPNHLLAAAAALHDVHWGVLAAITGLDLTATNEIEVLYHYTSGAAIVTLRVTVPHDDAAVPSLCGIIPSAGLFERELMEMFGVKVSGTPNNERLLLPDDWPEGVYPLRKDYVASSPEEYVKTVTGKGERV